jgi:RNA polymerase sigma factor (sigma-70 family)
MPDTFLTTRWSLVVTAQGDDTQAEAALETLCVGMWRPLYAFARRWGRGPEDAEDSVQSFLGSLLKRQSLKHVDATKGKFRTFLLGAMRNHLSDEDSRVHAVKRGGRVEVVSLDVNSAERDYSVVASESPSPEKAFERAWAMEIVARAQTKLREECVASGKAAVFDALFSTNQESGQQAADKLGISVNAFRTVATRLRQRWRALIQQELAQTVSSQTDLEAEMEALKRALL